MSSSPTGGALLQRKCACGGAAGRDDPCAECREEEPRLQRLAARRDGEASAPPIVHEVLRSSGQPLDPATRADIESRFGHDFSRVRVHTDAAAAGSARAVNALAYTVGQHIVFGAGRYQTTSNEGKRLLAHELAHVVQQPRTWERPQAGIAVDGSDTAAEREADEVADIVMRSPLGDRSGLDTRVSEGTLQRQDETPSSETDASLQAQKDCVKRLGGCPETRPGGVPSAEELEGYNQECRKETNYQGPDVTPDCKPAAQPQDQPQGRHACVLKEQIPIITTDVAVFDDEVMMQTDVDIRWQSSSDATSPCDCSCGEYRQFVKGHFIRNGQRIVIPLCLGAKLEEDVWHEDGDVGGFCPGHRDQGPSKNDVFNETDRASGCHYHGKDEPKLPGRPGDVVDVDLKFKGQTYDTCLDKFGPIHEWAFTFKGSLGSSTPAQ